MASSALSTEMVQLHRMQRGDPCLENTGNTHREPSEVKPNSPGIKRFRAQRFLRKHCALNRGGYPKPATSRVTVITL